MMVNNNKNNTLGFSKISGMESKTSSTAWNLLKPSLKKLY